ncbi:hypothetical protein DA69_00380 [Brevundimonas naejangsanensis]|uniref:Uncharacterized protein n=1 Tax=Brevundimonas naejangsanensis TaxID=588932 RepID=A0A172Y2C0_9CAUL|nr:DUF6491 family protein [Brevundimonas naejangsanensis]ANF53363.1 hypothetical protein DA69_00380 [Brevundimonas naejangsanensis]
MHNATGLVQTGRTALIDVNRGSVMTLRLAMAPALLAATFTIAACAPVNGGPNGGSSGQTAANATARQCIFQRDIRNFRVSNDGRNVYVRTGSKSVYQLETLGVCPDLENALAIGFKPNGGLTRLCVGDWTRIVSAPRDFDNTPCSVRMVKGLTDAEVAALPARDRP